MNDKNVDWQVKADELIGKHGNAFHMRVAAKLQSLGWVTTISPYYSDSVTDKPREVDIIAEKYFPLGLSVFGRSLGAVLVRLFVEAKYLNDVSVFWFQPFDSATIKQKIQAQYGLESPVDNYSHFAQHHYITPVEVAKLAASGQVQPENDPFYKGVTQAVNSLIYYRQKPPLGLPLAFKHRMTIEYPIVVVSDQDKLFKAAASEGERAEALTNPFCYELQYAYLDANRKSMTEYFLVDIIGCDQLEAYLQTVDEHDINCLKHSVAYQYEDEELATDSDSTSDW